MHLKLFLIFAFIFGGVNLHAQYVPTTWGSGVAMGSNQMQCAHEYKTADMITAGNKNIKADKKDLSRLKKERRNLKRDVTKLKRDMARNKRALNNNFKRNISNLLMDHLEEGRGPSSYKSCSASNSSECKNISPKSVPYEEKVKSIEESTNGNSPVSLDTDELSKMLEKCMAEKNTNVEICQQRLYEGSSDPSNIKDEKVVTDTVTKYLTVYSADNNSTSKSDKVTRFNDALRSIMNNGSDSNTAGNYDTPSEMCIPAPDTSDQDSLAMLYEQDGSTCLNLMKGFSNSDGTLNSGICSANIPIFSSGRDISKCREAIEDMNDLSSDLQAKLMDLEALDYAIEDAEDALKALQNDIFDEMVAEGKILEVECENCDEPVYREKPSMWSNVANIAGLVGGAAAAFYTADKLSDKNARLGWPTNPYLGLGVGFPLVMAGIHGGILGGQTHGGYGCAGGVGGAGGGAFGYPPGMFGGPVSGGMYMPGMGPWGMPGPWSGWGQMGGGGFLGGIAAGGILMGGMPMGGMPMGGMPMGGMPMGGMPMGGMPMGGMPMGGMPMGALAGGLTFLGGLNSGMPMGALAGGAGMLAGGGIPGMMAGGAGMLAGGGVPGMMAGGAGGNSAYLQMQMQMMEQQQRQMQIQMETEMRKAQQKQQAMQTISTLAQQIQQLQMQINTTYQGLFSESYIGGGGASFNSNTLVNGIRLNSNIPTRPGSHR